MKKLITLSIITTTIIILFNSCITAPVVLTMKPKDTIVNNPKLPYYSPCIDSLKIK